MLSPCESRMDGACNPVSLEDVWQPAHLGYDQAIAIVLLRLLK
jgi:hypothetical protein